MASRTTNYAEIQQDELEALRSIYMDDFKEEAVKTGAWNVGGRAFLKKSTFSASVVLNHDKVNEYLFSWASVGVLLSESRVVDLRFT